MEEITFYEAFHQVHLSQALWCVWYGIEYSFYTNTILAKLCFLPFLIFLKFVFANKKACTCLFEQYSCSIKYHLLKYSDKCKYPPL